MHSKLDKGIQQTRNSWFSKIVGIFSRPKMDDDLWEEFETLLLSADVGIRTAEKLLNNVKERMRQEKLTDSAQIRDALKSEIVGILKEAPQRSSIPVSDGLKVLLVVGVNGTGKTTSIAKLAYMYKNEGKNVLLAAADTFRAAAIEQLKFWGNKVGVNVIAHQQGSDPGAVVFDALEAARSRAIDVLIVDTAGRLHTKHNLMEELKKIKRIIERHGASYEVLLAIDATTGQNGLIQAKEFLSSAGVTGLILTKLDSTAKGGIVLAICDELKLPIQYVGTGEHLDDLAEFDPNEFAEALFRS